MTPSSRSRSHIRARIGAVVGAMVIGVVMLPGGVAVAAPVVQPAVSVPLGEPVLDSISRSYSEVPIPVGTTELTIEYGPGVDAVECYLRTGDPEDVVGWRFDPVVAERDVIDILPGTVSEGALNLQLVCRVPTGEDNWYLVPTLPAAAAATVTAGPDSLSQIDEYVHYERPTFAARPGQPVEFTAAPGALPAARIQGVISQLGEDYTGMGGQVTQDGGTARLTMPLYEEFQSYALPSVYPTFYGDWSVAGEVARVDGVPVIRTVQWRARIIMSDAPSAIKVAVSSTTATSFQQVKAIVVVTTTDLEWYGALGRIVVAVDGVEVRGKDLYYAMNGRWIVSLPKLARGAHVVTAAYSGAPWLAASTSNRAALRIVI